jgi:hypothetical protein
MGIVALLGKNRGDALAPGVLHQLIIDQHLVIGGIEPFHVVKLLFLGCP